MRTFKATMTRLWTCALWWAPTLAAAWLAPLAARGGPVFTFSVEGPCGLVLEGPPGAAYDDGTGGLGLFAAPQPGHTYDVLLTAAENSPGPGVFGWSWSLAGEGALEIVDVTTSETVSCWRPEGPPCELSRGYQLTQITTGEGNRGAAQTLALAFLGAPASLPPEGTFLIARLRVAARFPASAGESVPGRLTWEPDLVLPPPGDSAPTPEIVITTDRNLREASGVDCQVEFRARERGFTCEPVEVPPLDPARPAATGPGFSLPRIAAAVPDLSAITQADLDRDGRIDLAAAGGANGEVIILLGIGHGEFGEPRRFAGGTGPRGIAAADFDGDGALDVATANELSGEVTVLPGNGEGAFGVPRSFPAGDGPSGLAAADLNLDGNFDLAVTNERSGDVSVLLGERGGSFSGPSRFPAAGFGPSSPVAADFDGDGVSDVAVSGPGVRLLFGRSDGTLGVAQVVLDDQSPGIAAADVDADGAIDLLATSGSVLLNTGNGSFRLRQEPIPHGSWWVVAGDFDGDGILDRAFGSGPPEFAPFHASQTFIHVYRGRGDGAFSWRSDPGAGPSLQALAADLDGDAVADLATAGPQGVLVFQHWIHGDLWSASLSRVPVGSGPAAAAAADWNHDGLVDLATANLSSHEVSVLRAQSDGMLREDGRYATGREPAAIAAADLDGDGNIDLATANRASNDVSTLLGAGDGTFASAQSHTVERSPRAIAAADFNGDRVVDLATADFYSSGISVLLGNGDGGFAPDGSLFAGGPPSDLAAADFDGDGSSDLAASLPGALVVARGVRGGSFGAVRCKDLGDWPTYLAAADFDADGNCDLALGDGIAGSLTVLRGTGDGELDMLQRLPAAKRMSPLAAGDFDQDGFLDLAAAGSDRLLVFSGRGSGRFHAARAHAAHLWSFRAPDLVAFDVDGDGPVELALTVFWEDEVRLVANRAADCNRNGVADRIEITRDAGADANSNGRLDECEGALFHRGDPNHDGRTSLSDALFLISYFFLGGRGPGCRSSADANADSRLDIADAVYLIEFLFRGGPPPSRPGPPPLPCGPSPGQEDSSADIGCRTYERCGSQVP